MSGPDAHICTALWLHALFSIGGALKELNPRAADIQHVRKPYLSRWDRCNSRVVRFGHNKITGAAVRVLTANRGIYIRSKAKVVRACQISGEPAKHVRLLRPGARMSLREISREAIWVAMLAAADDTPHTGDRPCSLHDRFGQLGLPTLLVYYLEFL